MNITYTVRFRDLWRFNAVHQLRSVPLQLVLIVPAGLMAWSTATGSKCTGHGDCLGLGAFSFVIVYIGLLVLQLAFNAAYLYARNNRNVLTKHQVELRDDGIYEETAYHRSLFLWPGIHKIVTAAGFVAVYVTAHSALLVPNASFSTAAQRRDFIDAVKSKLRAA